MGRIGETKMTHDSSNKDCPRNDVHSSCTLMTVLSPVCCACKPKLDDIKARVESVKANRPDTWELYVKDEAALISMVEDAKTAYDLVKSVADESGADLSAAQEQVKELREALETIRDNPSSYSIKSIAKQALGDTND
jgi:hypothetical protein